MQEYDHRSHIPEKYPQSVVVRVFMKSQSSMKCHRTSGQARSIERRVGVSCVLLKEGDEKFGCCRKGGEIMYGQGSSSYFG